MPPTQFTTSWEEETVMSRQVPASSLPRSLDSSCGSFELVSQEALYTPHMYTHTFTAHVSTLCPVSRPSSPWPGDRSRQMLFLQAWVKWRRGDNESGSQRAEPEGSDCSLIPKYLR